MSMGNKVSFGPSVSPATMQAFPDMYGNPYGQQTNPYAVQQPMNQFGGPSFNQNSGYGPTFANMTGYGNFGGVYQPPQDQMPQRYSNDYNRFLQSGQSFNEPVMGYNSYGQIFAPPRQQPPSFGKGGGGFRPQPPAPPLGGKGRAVSPGVPGDRPFNNGYFQDPNAPSQPPTMGGKGQPQNQGPFMSYPGGSGYGGLTARPGSGPPRVPRTRQLGLNEPTGPGPMDVQTNPSPPQIADGVPQSFLDFYSRQNNPPQPNLDFYNRQNNPDSVRAYPTNQQSITMPGQGPVAATGGVPQDNIYNPAYQQQMAALNIARQNQNVPPQGYMLNPNYNPATAMQTNVPLPGSPEALARQQFIPSTGGLGLGGMPTGGPQISPDYMPVMGARNFDIQPFGARDNYIPHFGNMGFFQEGGQVPPDAATNMEMMLSEAGPANPQAEMSGEYDRLIQMTMQAVLGQVEQPDEIIQMFIDEFGVDAFRQLRDAVLKQQVPNAQTEGMVDGNGGGMDDQVMGMIGAQRPVAVSPGEYIIPADVVSGLGDGSSKSGADILDELSQAVRMTRTGTTEQPRPLMETLSQ
jgi:hypothetical protein